MIHAHVPVTLQTSGGSRVLLAHAYHHAWHGESIQNVFLEYMSEWVNQLNHDNNSNSNNNNKTLIFQWYLFPVHMWSYYWLVRKLLVASHVTHTHQAWLQLLPDLLTTWLSSSTPLPLIHLTLATHNLLSSPWMSSSWLRSFKPCTSFL